MITHIWVFVKTHIWQNALVLAFVALLVVAMTTKLCDWIKSFRPFKIKGNELAWWHIEREASPNGFIPHCHEYNFAGTLSLIPRVNAILNEISLNIQIDNQYQKIRCISDIKNEHMWLNPNTERVEYKNIINDVLDNPITDNFSFQTRLDNEIIIPNYAYIVIRHKRGESKIRVSLKRNNLRET
jgi:hypothetical protein